MELSGRHRKNLSSVFVEPALSNVLWTDVESLLGALGAELSEGHGARGRVYLNGVRAVFHRPHPRKETDKGALKAVRRFLIAAGIERLEKAV